MSRVFRGGHAGKILRVDLTKRKVVDEGLSATLIKKFIGGRGFGAKIMFEEQRVRQFWVWKERA
jgi:aldehyde:ferredoxin oxidoreductase